MATVVIALDQGTSSTRAIAFAMDGTIVAREALPHSSDHPAPGWVEQDPLELLRNARAVLERVAGSLRADGHAISGIAITNQTETTVVWDRATGIPVYPAIVWQDAREHPVLERVSSVTGSSDVRSITGSPLSAYYSASKLHWILDHVPGARDRASRGELLFGNVNTWLAWSICDERPHVTDVTNASRTLLFDIRRLTWSSAMLELFEVPAECLPEVQTCDQRVGTIKDLAHMGRVPVVAMIGDQQAALVGQGALNAGDTKVTYGTGAFLLTNTGNTTCENADGLLNTIAFQLAGMPATYAIEGSIASAGSLINWIVGLGLASSPDHLERMAAEVESSGGVTLVPALTGLLAPHWRLDARGVIVGLTAATTPAHLARAALDSVAFQVNDVLQVVRVSYGPIEEILVDGGLSRSDVLMATQADVSQVRVRRPANIEITAAGAARMAMYGLGLIADLKKAAPPVDEDTWIPRRRPDHNLLAAWDRAVTFTGPTA